MRSGTTTMKMISSTSTTSTSGVTLMAACILVVSPRRMRHLLLFNLCLLACRYFEQAVPALGRSPVHLNVGILNLAGEVVECDDGRDRDEDAKGCRDQRLSDTAGDHTHTAGPGGRDAPESVDDPDHRAEQADERGRGADRGQEPETPLQLDQRFGDGVPDCALNELERGARIASGLTHAVVLEDAR